MKRLYLSRTEKKIAGVCGGLSEYFDIDPTIVRLLVILGAFVTAVVPVVIGYIIAWIIVPVRPAEPVQTA
jgi:phage shock protein PspC (stress-responsive transcriptional regulator)